MSDLPRAIKVHTEPALHQAVCERCGWHTRAAPKMEVIQHLAVVHKQHCPNPLRANGARMACGCWWLADFNTIAGVTSADCPVHGRVLMTEANVLGSPWGTRTWEPADA